MDYRLLGRSALSVSVVGLGCNNFGGRIDRAATRRVVHQALDLGITLFDTADIYGNLGASEEFLGEALGARRKEVVLASKFGMAMDERGKLQGASRRYIVSAIEASLKRLKTDWIDLYQLHRPDPKTAIEETLRALDDLIRQGKVRYIGHSNFNAEQIDEAQVASDRLGLAAFISCQNEYSLLAREIEHAVMPACVAHGLGILPYFPLAGGLLTGKYRQNAPLPEGARLSYMAQLADRYMTAANWRMIAGLRQFAEIRGHSLLELAFAWLAAKPAVASVIAGATTPEQVAQNAAAVAWHLDAAALAEIDRLAAPGLRP